MKELDEKLSLLLDDYSDENIDTVLDEVTADVICSTGYGVTR